MDYNELNLVELNNIELETIDGGGFFYDLGVGTRMIWNSIDRFLENNPDMTSHSRQGI